MNAEMIDDLTRIDPRELEDFLEEMDDIMREEMIRIDREEEQRQRINCLAEAFKW